MIQVDALVVGAGALGLAIARALQRAGHETVLVETEASFGTQTSSRNSEVIHAGIYYPAGSHKARYCVAGREKLYAYCEHRNVPCRRIGKLIVAASLADVSVLADYERRALANGVDDLTWVDQPQIAAMEPAIRAEAGLHSPSTGIIDSHAYMLALLHDFQDAGGVFLPKTAFARAHPAQGGQLVRLSDGTDVQVHWLINAAGHGAPNVAAAIDGLAAENIPDAAFAIGHYYTLRGRVPFNRLIYPVAEAGGLGVHVTLDLAGRARFGPDVRWIETLDYSFDDSRRADFAAAIRRYYPAIEADDLEPSYTGIRPKIGTPGASDVDFRIDGPTSHGRDGVINLFGIESPGLTASLAIADAIADWTRGATDLP